MKKLKNVFLLMLTMIIVMSPYSNSLAYTRSDLDSKINATSSVILKTVSKPEVSSLGGEWVILGLSRGGIKVPEKYYENYYKKVEETVKSKKGILHDKKYTEYSRVILALTAIGKDPSNVSGYNLLEKLADFEKVTLQGINGPVFALLALDSGLYEIPLNRSAKTPATRELYIDYILKRQLSDGGFALSAKTADTDITAMVLQALAKYQERKDVRLATQKALSCLSKIQKSDGGFESWGSANLESSAQVLTALCELGISDKDRRFVKNGKTVTDNVLSYHTKNGFLHIKGGNGNTLMATEQAFYSLVGLQRTLDSKTSLYRMDEKVTK
ncbi:MAG: hypothetical protein EOM45_04525 [Clostridia bacterium]|nr:hypothetical protein [Clostridia bacterium]